MAGEEAEPTKKTKIVIHDVNEVLQWVLQKAHLSTFKAEKLHKTNDIEFWALYQ